MAHKEQTESMSTKTDKGYLLNEEVWELDYNIADQLDSLMIDLNCNINELSIASDIPISYLNAIINDEVPITREIAEKLGTVIYDADFWLRLGELRRDLLKKKRANEKRD